MCHGHKVRFVQCLRLRNCTHTSHCTKSLDIRGDSDGNHLPNLGAVLSMLLGKLCPKIADNWPMNVRVTHACPHHHFTLTANPRFFGGTKLGAGGLVRAYGGAARECLRSGDKIFVRPSVTLDIKVGGFVACKSASCCRPTMYASSGGQP